MANFPISKSDLSLRKGGLLQRTFGYGNGVTIPASARGARAPRYADPTGQRDGLREHPLKPPGGTLCFLKGCVPLSQEVAGHMYGKDKVGLLQHPDGCFETATATSKGPKRLRKYLPKYYGIWSPPTAPSDLYLKLEDATHPT
ncbi:hypothetical protein QTO34_010363 [Cnephaeus nilssonii]|uniref:Uncharacterized protein n=1 Tax=Cnephaeus nilssonii TaxID=3371016 RepID=A0AA40HG30_CNENI|nr:hypothetical protein QTO34_010363 [Eptesicus nilssonii]